MMMVFLLMIRMRIVIEFSNNYAKTSKTLWQYHKDDPNDNIKDSESLKLKAGIARRTPAAGNTVDVEIVVNV